MDTHQICTRFNLVQIFLQLVKPSRFCRERSSVGPF